MKKPAIIKSKGIGLIGVLAAMFMLFGWVVAGLAQESKIDLNMLIQETQKMSQETDEMTLIWWIPEEYWQVSFAQDPTTTEAQTEEFLKVLRPYTLIAVVDGKMGAFGGVTYRPEADVRAGIQIRDSQGAYYLPLSKDKIDVNTNNFLSMMKPVFANMLGPMGQNMHFFVFPAVDKDGRKIAEVKKDGDFSVELDGREFRWRLPLSSLLLPKVCLKCKEKCSGAWHFCPWCGASLPE